MMLRQSANSALVPAVATALLVSGLTSIARAEEQWASQVISFSSQYDTPDYAATQALGEPDTFEYADTETAWTPEPINGTLESITLGFERPVYADAVLIRETYGNGFVYQVDVLDTNNQLHPVWSGVDSSPPGAPVDFLVTFARTNYLVDGVKIYVDTDHDLNAWEEIDAVQLRGQLGVGGCGFGAAPMALVLLGLGLMQRFRRQ